MRAFSRRALVVLALALVLVVSLHTPPSKRAAGRILISLLERRLGGTASLETIDYRLWRGEIEVSGFEWSSGGVQVRVRDLLVRLSPWGPVDVRATEPDVRITLSGTSGDASTVLPAALLGGRLAIANGAVRVEWPAESLLFELSAIEGTVVPENGTAHVAFSAGAGRVKTGETDIAFEAARARALLAPTEIQIEEARLERDESFVTASGRLGPLSPLTAEVRFEHSIEGSLAAEIDSRIALEGVLSGEGSFRRRPGTADQGDGTFRARGLSWSTVGPFALEAGWKLLGESASADLTFEGDAPEPLASVASGRLALSVDGFRLETVRGEGTITLRAPDGDRPAGIPLRGDIALRVESSRISFSTERLAVQGAEVAGSGTIGESVAARFRARIEDLGELEALGVPRPPVVVNGPLDLEGTVEGTLRAPSMEARLTSAEVVVGETPFALTGNLRFRDSRIEVPALSLHGTNGGSIDMNGRFATSKRGGALELVARIESVPVAGVVEGVSSGTLTASLEASGSISQPSFETSFTAIGLAIGDAIRADLVGTAKGQGLAGKAELRVGNVFFREREIPGTRFVVDSDGETARLSAELDDGNEIATARVTLRSPFPLEAAVPLENLPMARVRELFPALTEEGTELEVAGLARVEGTLEDFEALRYRIDVERILTVYRGIVLGASSPFVLEGTREGFSVSDLTLVGEDTAIGIEGLVPLSRDGSVVIHARGASRLELLRPWFPDIEPAGRANVDVRIEGALPDPWLRGELSLEEASARVANIAVENVQARARWSDRALLLEELSGDTLGGTFRVSGELPPQLIDPSAQVHLRFEAKELEPLRLTSSEGDLRVDLEGELRGSGTDFSRWEGSGTLQAVRFSMRGFEIANEAPGPWSFQGGRLQMADFRMTRGETRLVFGGEVSLEDPLAWTARASGKIDHAVSRTFLEEMGLDFTGATELDVRAAKKGEHLDLNGRGTFRNARLVVRDPPIVFTNVSGEIALAGSTIALTGLTADAGGGKVEADGTLDLVGLSVQEVDLKASARSVRLNYPEGLRSEMNGTVRLRGHPDRLRLTGDADLARALLSRDISVESELLQSLSRVSGRPKPDSFGSRVEVELRVRAADAFRIDNNLARMEASVNLTVGGTLDSPELDGIVSVRPGGRFRFGGNEYRVETGRILLRGYPDTPPELEITARTSVGQYDIRLRLRGATDNLSTELSSENHAELSRGDLASLLITGRTLGEVSSASRDIVSNRMVSYLGSTLGDLAKLGIGEALPFEILTVEPSLIAGEADPGARFTIGARFNNRLSLVYSIGLDDADNQIWVVDYELPRRIRTQIVRDENNEYTLGLAQEVRFDLRDRGRSKAAKEVISESTVTFEEGASSGPLESEVRRVLRSNPNERYDYWKTWEKAEKARRMLRSRGHLEAIVEVSASPSENGGFRVEYRIRVGPTVRFVFPDDQPDGSLRDALENSWTGDASESFLTTDLASLTTRKLFEEGYFTATAELTTERSEEELLVKVFLERGPRGDKVLVEVDGNEAVSDSFLLEPLPKPRSGAFHDFLTTKRSRLKQIVALQYASRGYITASVGDPGTAFDPRTRSLKVTIPVTEGARFFLRRIELPGVAAEDEPELRSRLSLREGEPFRVQSFAQDRAAIAAFYRERGHVDAEVDAALSEPSTSDELDARFAVSPGPRVTVGEVVVGGNSVTRESVIRREIKFAPGAPLSASALRETERGLYDLGIFQSAEAAVEEAHVPEEGGEPSNRAVRIAVVETEDLELEYGGRASTDGFFEVLTELRAPNLFGRAQHAGVRALVGSERQIFRFSYHSPYLSRYRLDTDFFAERNIERQETEFLVSTDRLWTFTAQQTRPLTERIDAQWSYTFKRLVTQIDEDFLASKRSIVTGSLIGDHRDNMLLPRRGSLWLLTTQLAPEFLGSDLRFTKLFGQFFLYLPLHEEIVWASGYRLGVANSFGQRLDEEDGFRAGGPNSVRGFEQDALGPTDILGLVGGGGVVVFNQEIRFPLWWRFRGVGFYDAGNAFETASDIRLSELRQSIGAGLRFELPFGLIRVDWATVVNPLPGEKPWRLLFSLGDAF